MTDFKVKELQEKQNSIFEEMGAIASQDTLSVEDQNRYETLESEHADIERQIEFKNKHAEAHAKRADHQNTINKVAANLNDRHGISVDETEGTIEQYHRDLFHFLTGKDDNGFAVPSSLNVGSYLEDFKGNKTRRATDPQNIISTSAQGGANVIPTYTSEMMVKSMKKASVMMELGRHTEVTSIADRGVITVDYTGTDAGAPNEGAAATGTDPSLNKVTIKPDRKDSGTVEVSYEVLYGTSLNDLGRDIFDLLGGALGRKVNTDFTKVLTDAMGAGNRTTASGKTLAAITLADYSSMIGSLDEAYEDNGDASVIMFNKQTFYNLLGRSISSTDARPSVYNYYVPGDGGATNRHIFMGHPVRFNTNITAVPASGNVSGTQPAIAVIGDWSRFHIHNFSMGTVFNRFQNEQEFASKAKVGFHALLYTDAGVADSKAFQFLRAAA